MVAPNSGDARWQPPYLTRWLRIEPVPIDLCELPHEREKGHIGYAAFLPAQIGLCGEPSLKGP